MSLQTLRLFNFRSYKEVEFDFSPKTTVITGKNGSGKTNLVEAVYLLGMTKSWRGQSGDLIRNGAEWMRLEAEYGQHTYQFRLKEDKKLLIDGKIIKPQNFLGKIPVVLFEPGDLAIINGAPVERRRFMDIVLAATNGRYMSSLLKYRRVVTQRNKVLRVKPLPKEQIFAWDMLLAREAAVITENRREFMGFISANIDRVYRDISGTKDKVKIAYNGLPAADYVDKLLDALRRNLDRDVIMGSTSVGPHRDDPKITYNGRSFKQRGSRGEVRSLALAVKMLQLEYVRGKTDKSPVLLLDDVFSELDESRQRNVLNQCRDVQTIITTTSVPATISKPRVIELP